MAESALDREIMNLIRARGGWCVKTHGGSFMPAGTPDILACYRGHFIGIEDKVEGNTARAIQVKTLRDIARAGGHHLVAYDAVDVVELLATIDRAIAEQSTKESACPERNEPQTSWSYQMWKTGNVPPAVPRP